MSSQIFDLADRYIGELLTRSPMMSAQLGIDCDRDVEDLGPESKREKADLDRRSLAELNELTAHSAADERARVHMRERLEAQIAAFDSGEWMRDLRAPFGTMLMIVGHFDALPKETADDWKRIIRRANGVNETLRTYRDTLNVGLAENRPASRRQALEMAEQARNYVAGRTFDKHLDAYGDGDLREELTQAFDAVYRAFEDFSTYLEKEYAPGALDADGVGIERYQVAARLMTGSDLDLREAYDWGWEELHRIEAEMEAEAERILPGAGLDEVIDHLYRTEVVEGLDAYRAWLEETHERAFEKLDGVHFDIDPRLRELDIEIQTDSSSGAASYSRPSEDLKRPGKTNWPVHRRDVFPVWDELTTVFHEGVPGHHLQIGQLRVVGDSISRFSKTNMPSAYTEGWALYAERLCDELGWFETPATRLGMLTGSATRAARVVIDIGLHCGFEIPGAEAERHGAEWNFDVALDFLINRGRIAPDRARPEIVRYAGWPGQAITYKLGERAWLAARDEAKRLQGENFDLKAWHTKALNAGPVGLDNLTAVLADVTNE
ncbi:DUF885 domain-containing protein [Haloglycomyces albus]|uniref:DUF885 domain-containing protein n=1 Tax=Haloglycomyces albus TaxID=526067 RepID=UPI00046D90A7|nr:DUF885 domain-containing protein [Haloglycomyces albus]